MPGDVTVSSDAWVDDPTLGEAEALDMEPEVADAWSRLADLRYSLHMLWDMQGPFGEDASSPAAVMALSIIEDYLLALPARKRLAYERAHPHPVRRSVR